MKLRSKNTEKWRNKIYEENPSDGIQKSLVCSMGMVQAVLSGIPYR